MAIINGTGNDDTLNGGAGNDTITGGLGNDLALMAGGADVFVWNAGHGSDTVEGGAGIDTLRIFAASAAEQIAISANGARTRVQHDLSSAALDLNDVERLELWTLGGADAIRIDNLAGTDVKQVAVDLAGLVPGAGDGEIDSVTQFGTDGKDTIKVALANGRVAVTGLFAQVTIGDADSTDTLTIDGAGGNDVIDASKLAAGVMQLTLVGGNGNDTITGTKGADSLKGGNGNDTVIGDDGDDQVDLGNDDDLFTWLAGDGHDMVDGSQGYDTVRFTGSNAAEELSVGVTSGWVTLSEHGEQRVVADNVENVQLRALGGADNIIVYNLAGADLQRVTVDLAATAGGAAADSSVDTVRIAGTISDDVVDVWWSGTDVRVDGVGAEVAITHAGKTDILWVDGNEGDDTINAAALIAGKMSLQLLGGSGNDMIFGSAGNDSVIGGSGNDLAFLGAGNDQYVAALNHGDDTIEGQAGFDTLTLNTGFGSDVVDIAANGNRVVASSGGVALDLNDMERIQVQAAYGGDTITVGNLAGTDLKQVAIDLGVLGASNGAIDSVVARGTGGNDHVTVAMSAGAVSVTGLQAQVTIAHAELQDELTIVVGSGDDVVNAATLPAGTLHLTIGGYDGNDILTGGAGNDELFGDAGADTLRGGAGTDTLDGGTNNDYLDGGSGDDILRGDTGDDVILGGLGDDLIAGNSGNDTITGGAGNDTFKYGSTLDGRDVILDFDGDAVGGQDVLNLDALFDLLGVADGSRAGRVQLTDNGGTVDVHVNADGNGGNGFELHVATLTTAHEITLGQDVILVG